MEPNDVDEGQQAQDEKESALPILPFEKLPFEMIEEIFKCLSPNQRQKLRRVNQIWNYAISNFFIVRLELNVNNWRTIIKTDAQMIFVVISGLNEKLEFGAHIQDVESFCLRIRKVEFSGLTQVENILAILLKCKSVKKLTLSKACPVKKRVYSSTISDIIGFESLPQNWNVPQDFLSKLISFRVNLDGKEWRDNLDLFEAVDKMLCTKKLKKLKIHSVRGDASRRWTDVDDGKVLAVVHGMTTGFVVDEQQERREGGRYQRILSSVISRHKSTLEKLSIAKYNENPDEDDGEELALKFYPRVHEQDGFRVRTFRGTKMFYDNDDSGIAGALGPWLRYLQRQDGLQTLNLKFLDSETQLFDPGYENYFHRDTVIPDHFMYNILPRILLNNTATLTIVNLSYQFFMTGSAKFNFSDGFPNCVNLRSLTVFMGTYHRQSGITPISPNFVGISQLPPSLKYFCTNFTLRSEVSTIDQLDLGNLKNLETLIYAAQPPFILNDSDPVAKMNLEDFKTLRSKLPGLKKFLWGVGDHKFQNWIRVFRRHSSPTLTKEVRKLARLNLEYRKQYGPLYQFKLRDLNRST